MTISPFIPVNEPLLDGNEKKYLQECIDTGWISSEGPFVTLFEERLASRVDRQFGIAVANGTAALDIAIDALGIGPGDEVILPSFTIISCIAQIVRVGATPVLIDSDELTWNMKVSEIEGKITKKTKAILIVHIYGLPVDVDPVLEIARQNKLFVIEDAAEMHGQTYKGRPCGSFGDISIFSFYPNKHVTTGEGGMLVTNDPHLAEVCRGLRNLCFQPAKRFVHERLGWNYRMTNLQAALGVAQLERLEEFILRKRRMGAIYTKLLTGLPGVRLPVAETAAAKNIYWVYGLLIEDNRGVDADWAIKRLAEKNIGCRPFFCPMHSQPVLKTLGLFAGQSFPHADRLYKQGFYIPSGMALSDQQIERVSESVWKIFG